jgi:hypothetical protein
VPPQSGGMETNMKTIKINIYNETVALIPHFFLYQVGDFMGEEMSIPGIQLTQVAEEGEKPFATLTKSFGEFIGIKDTAYIDINNCPFADVFIKEGIAVDTGFTKESGFCSYPLWKFNEDFLKEIGGCEYENYSQAFEQYMYGDDEQDTEQVQSDDDQIFIQSM